MTGISHVDLERLIGVARPGMKIQQRIWVHNKVRNLLAKVNTFGDTVKNTQLQFVVYYIRVENGSRFLYLATGFFYTAELIRRKNNISPLK